jgi:hypothetical protein
MNRYVAVLLFLVSLALPVQAAFAQQQEAGEGYARPNFNELVQTMVMMNGFDINNPKVADEYGKILYCDLYRKNFGNDIIWDKIRKEIVTRILKKKEYFRVRYEVVGIFNLGRYDFKTQFFPISTKTSIKNVGSVGLDSFGNYDCMGNISTMFPQNIILQLNQPLTIKGFAVPLDKVEKMMVRIEEAGNVDRRVYGRIRVVVTDAKSIDATKNNTYGLYLNGRVVSVDFFIDPALTKPLGSVHISRD